MKLLDLLLEIQAFNTIDDAIRILDAGGVKINFVKQREATLTIETEKHILKNNFTLIQIGI